LCGDGADEPCDPVDPADGNDIECGSDALADPRVSLPRVPVLRPDIGSNPGEDIGVDTRCVTIPFFSTFCDSLAMLSNCPRGTPMPAELLRITTLLPERAAIVEAGPRFTITVPVPVVGALGATNPAGAFNTATCVYIGIQTPPGCHAHP
jgi:hypothetical protein